MQKITLLISDDHTLVREIWGQILNNNPLFTVIAECSTGEEAVEKAQLLRPNVVIMDINLPGMNGIEATQLIRKFSPASKILGVSLHSQPAYARKMMKSGASGYITKNSTKDEMFKAIQEVYNGRKYICEEIKTILSEQMIDETDGKKGINSLSNRELEIIDEVKKGSSSKEIASLLNISVKTVEVHRYNILKKLGLKNVAELVNFIHKHPEMER